MDVNDVELPEEVLSSQKLLPERNRSHDVCLPHTHRPIAIELDLCLYRAVTELWWPCGVAVWRATTETTGPSQQANQCRETDTARDTRVVRCGCEQNANQVLW
jgi:hypothetical protein